MLGTTHKVHLTELSDQDLTTVIGQFPTVLIGSPISSFAPTNLPSGEGFGRGLLTHLIADSREQWPEWLKRDYAKVPFEALVEIYPRQTELRSRIADYFSRDLPNDFHRVLAGALASGRLAGLITTNYDRAFEACLEGRPDVAIIVSEKQAGICDPHARTLFKIHGSAESGSSGKDLVLSLRDEGLLPPGKARLLQSMIADRNLIVLCYSGRDFDICPQIASHTKPGGVVWLQREEEVPTENAMRVLAVHQGLIIVGDIRQLLHRLFGLRPGIADPLPDPIDDLFDRGCIPEWRTRILDRLACPVLGSEELENLHLADPVEEAFLNARMHSHAGRYRQAAACLLAAAASRGLEDPRRVECLTGAAGTFLSYGSARLARRRYAEAEETCRTEPSIRPHILLAETRMTLCMRRGITARRFWCRWIFRRAQRDAKVAYALAKPILEQEGRWDELQTLQHNAERLEIAETSGPALMPLAGYLSLGLAGMAAIRERDELRRGPWCFDRRRAAKARGLLRQAERYGWCPEAWKLAWMLLWRAGRLRFFGTWSRNFWRTEYSILARCLGPILQLRTLPAPDGRSQSW
jgi:tetratricopeptide (TPR) repeat protein